MTAPQWALISSSFVNRLGTGLFVTTSILYFTRIRHLDAQWVGLGLTIAGAVGLLSGIPVGHLADRHGPRMVTLTTLVVQAATMAAFVLVRSWVMFTVLATLDLLAASANNASRGALIARVGGDNPAAFRSRLRSFVNLAILLGSGGAIIVIQLDSTVAYTALILVNAATYVIAALLLLRVPHYSAHPPVDQISPLSALRDRPYVAFAALNGALGFHYPIMTVLLPIWITVHTHAPPWTVAVAYLCNAALCIAFQVRLGSRVETVRDGGLAFRRAGLIFLVTCPLIALAANLPAWAAMALLIAAVSLHSIGEVLHASAGFALGFGLAPDHSQGQYQGMLGLGFDLGQAVAPAFLAFLCLGHGQAGWLVLAGLFGVLGVLGPPVAQWAGGRRPDPVVAEEAAA
ncbi:MAG: MFS transporter [Frankia sp.]